MRSTRRWRRRKASGEASEGESRMALARACWAKAVRSMSSSLRRAARETARKGGTKRGWQRL